MVRSNASGRKGYRIAKRLMDVVGAAAGLVLLSPLFGAIAVVVRRSSPGPVFYRGERVGLHGRHFKIWKFRTMVQGADRFGFTTSLDDVRLTRWGVLLRRYKLDELPQLINVLRGEMSLVGPRPEVEVHTREYTGSEKQILSVRPGITDYASVQFVNHEELIGCGTPEEAHEAFVSKLRAEKNRLRLLYVDRCSFLEDLRILFRTLWTVFLKVVSPQRLASPPARAAQPSAASAPSDDDSVTEQHQPTRALQLSGGSSRPGREP